jgi:hypothetical protein
LNNWHYSELDGLESSKLLGIAETSLLHFPAWVNAHPARKVILHRPLFEINESLAEIGLPAMAQASFDALAEIEGHHHQWTDLFSDPKPIYEFLLQRPFDPERHAELINIEMQPRFSGLMINKDVAKRLLNEVLSTVKE